MNFNVDEFGTIINNIIIKSNEVNECLERIFQNIETLKNRILDLERCIDVQKNRSIYDSWCELESLVGSVKQKYLSKNEKLLSLLNNYKELTTQNNREMNRRIMYVNEQLGEITNQINKL